MTNQNYIRLCALRSLMAAKGWDALVLRGSDPHSSEYFAPRYQVVRWLSGFTGESGDVVVTKDHAGLWTDSRYFIQAGVQLKDTGFQLHTTRMIDSVYIPEWLSTQSDIKVVACDSLCESAEGIQALRKVCNAIPGGELCPVPDLPDLFWPDRPAVPSTPIITLDESTTGLTRAEKLEWLREWMRSEPSHPDFYLLSALDEVAWMLNVRGSDIEYNPVVFSYLLVGQDSAQWFVKKSDSADEDTLDSYAAVEADGVSAEPYSSAASELQLIGNQGYVIGFDPTVTNGCLSACDGCVPLSSPVALKKAVKTDVEIEGMREAHLEDGLALEKFLYWLETTLRERPVSEWEASCRLSELRAEIPGYQGDSFETISAWGPGGALPHYATPRDGSTEIPANPDGFYLVDSGGQYLFGTTDVTRTVPFGQLTPGQKEDYTIVLKGMIDLTMAVFPYGTAGCQIDAFARGPLWRSGRNFGHGTGHGIGFFLNVHEGPQSIRQNFLSQPLLPGMITSNEPALYREGSYGIRHENVILCREAFTTEFGRFLSFETLTSCHFDTSAIIPELLSPEEISWLNDYNDSVYRNYASAIEDENFRLWLRNKTLPL